MHFSSRSLVAAGFALALIVSSGAYAHVALASNAMR
jgi:hypothetical protein